MTTTCSERFFRRGDDWHSVPCERPAKGEALVRPYGTEPEWKPKCGVHLRRWQTTRPLEVPK